jgi:mRNA deadenylase 3'-5' endonuclease subunit Ccr4
LDSVTYTPTEEDVGKIVSVVLVPYRHDHDGTGCEEAYEFQRIVEKLPELPIVYSLRQEFIRPRVREEERTQTKKKEKEEDDLKDEDEAMSLRVVSYNILADQNASRDVMKKQDDLTANRMYGHCKNEHIIKFRRHPLIVHEILSYDPDVIALQEVDTDIYENLLLPVLTVMGYQGYYSQKGIDVTSSVREGCAIFWSTTVFEYVRPVDMRTHTFRDMIQQFSCEERMHKRQWTSLNDMSNLLEKHEHLKHVLHNKLGHVFQTVVLTRKDSSKNRGEKVVIGNTHLFYHPMASHIRCLKMLMACRQLEIEHFENEMCPIIFCGDLNSHPNSGKFRELSF